MDAAAPLSVVERTYYAYGTRGVVEAREEFNAATLAAARVRRPRESEPVGGVAEYLGFYALRAAVPMKFTYRELATTRLVIRANAPRVERAAERPIDSLAIFAESPAPSASPSPTHYALPMDPRRPTSRVRAARPGIP